MAGRADEGVIRSFCRLETLNGVARRGGVVPESFTPDRFKRVTRRTVPPPGRIGTPQRNRMETSALKNHRHELQEMEWVPLNNWSLALSENSFESAILTPFPPPEGFRGTTKSVWLA